jgi:hypothetical protein
MITPFMFLSLPTPSVTLGPAWATQLNAALSVVDSHDHSNGNGTTVKSAGISINADLPFNGFRATVVKALRLDTQASTLAGVGNSQSVYTYNGDLYWTNGGGVVVQITAGGSLSAISGAVDVIEYESISANTTLTVLNKPLIGITSSGSSLTITLPAAASVTAGRIFVLKDESGNSETYPISVVPDGADVIDGQLTFTIDSNYGAAFLVSDGNLGWISV